MGRTGALFTAHAGIKLNAEANSSICKIWIPARQQVLALCMLILARSLPVTAAVPMPAEDMAPIGFWAARVIANLYLVIVQAFARRVAPVLVMVIFWQSSDAASVGFWQAFSAKVVCRP